MMNDKQGNQLHPLKHELGPIEDISCALDAGGHCITCSDEALQVRVLYVDDENGLAQVTLHGAEDEIDISLVESIAPGDVLLVHGGVAIARVDEASNA
ncbi:MAG TPA: HypC/HybG/HupF family hydrogenase formation chaperone [Ktedonobacteraceae bacterium]